MPPAAEREPAGLTRFKELFALTDPIEIYCHAKDLYAEDAYLNDGLKEMRGADAIAKYLRKSVDAVSQWSATVDDTARSGDEHYVRWSVTYSLKIRKKRPITTSGISHVRFNEEGKVTYQRDYWDPISGLFEHLPVAGPVIRLLMRLV